MEKRVSLDDLEERLDEEIARVNQLTEEFTTWSEEQRTKLDAAMRKRLSSQGDVPISDFKFIVDTLSSIDSQPQETIDHLIHLLEQVSNV